MEVFSVLQLFELFSWFFLIFYVVYCFTRQTTIGKIFKKENNAPCKKRGRGRPRVQRDVFEKWDKADQQKKENNND